MNGYMNEPQDCDGQAYTTICNNEIWVHCCWCGKKQFKVDGNAVIKNQTFKCKGSNCKKEFIVNVVGIDVDGK